MVLASKGRRYPAAVVVLPHPTHPKSQQCFAAHRAGDCGPRRQEPKAIACWRVEGPRHRRHAGVVRGDGRSGGDRVGGGGAEEERSYEEY